MFCPAEVWGEGYQGDCQAACGTSPRFANKSTFWRQMACPAMTAGNGLSRCPAGAAQFAEPLPGLSGFYTSYHRCLGRVEPARRGGKGAPPAAAGVCSGQGSCTETAAGEGETCGFGCDCSRAPMLEVNIVDRVIVPGAIEPGHYLVSWRWDAEQSNQVWQNCGDVDVV
eukprot:SAG22_NODE_4165_length_1362_cov_1.596991_1_plen_169_part_00